MLKKSIPFIFLAGLLNLIICSGLYAQAFLADPQSPCYESISRLEKAYYSTTDTKFKALIDKTFANIQQLPLEYTHGNPWIGKKFSDLVLFLNEWSAFLPTASGSHDTGLRYIEQFDWLYYKNKYGVDFVQTSPGLEIMQDFSRQRGKFMDSQASTTHIAKWLSDVRMEKEDYLLPDPNAPDGGFKSFNDFFVRTLKDQNKSRPQTMPDRDYVISAPTDAIMNSIPQKITDADTLIPTKGHEALNIKELLGGSKYAEKFIGGTSLSCILMPNTYHRYHAPVSGDVVESAIIEDAYYGYDNFPEWVTLGGNVGYHGTDFSQFENFKRGYFVVDTGKYGHVAIVPVGLNTISSIVFNKRFSHVTVPVPVKRGDELGYFKYGGSLVILIFEPGRYSSGAIKVRLGNQIGIFDTKDSDPE
jgi:phosphatidylserine decarboxylase